MDSGYLPWLFSTVFLRQGFSLILELVNSPSPAIQLALGSPVCLLHNRITGGHCTCVLTFMWVLGMQTQPSCLSGISIIHWAIFPGPSGQHEDWRVTPMTSGPSKSIGTCSHCNILLKANHHTKTREESRSHVSTSYRLSQHIMLHLKYVHKQEKTGKAESSLLPSLSSTSQS